MIVAIECYDLKQAGDGIFMFSEAGQMKMIYVSSAFFEDVTSLAIEDIPGVATLRTSRGFICEVC